MMYRSKGHSTVHLVDIEENKIEWWNKGSDDKYKLIRTQNFTDRQLLEHVNDICTRIMESSRIELVSMEEMSGMESFS